jgi:hypothetical protein
MPRNVRNWWATVHSDRDVSTGPVAKDGTLDIDLLARDHGSIVESFRLRGRAYNDGTLEMIVYGPDGQEVARHVTVR